MARSREIPRGVVNGVSVGLTSAIATLGDQADTVAIAVIDGTSDSLTIEILPHLQRQSVHQRDAYRSVRGAPFGDRRPGAGGGPDPGTARELALLQRDVPSR